MYKLFVLFKVLIFTEIRYNVCVSNLIMTFFFKTQRHFVIRKMYVQLCCAWHAIYSKLQFIDVFIWFLGGKGKCTFFEEHIKWDYIECKNCLSLFFMILRRYYLEYKRYALMVDPPFLTFFFKCIPHCWTFTNVL